MKKKSKPKGPLPKVVKRRLRAGAGAVAFPIVGIGASAGGLEALQRFFGGVPASSGMAYVIVQHFDPTKKGIMPELLQRFTGMNVQQVRDRTRVRPDCVYVIPPNRDMSILHGTLHLLAPVAPRGLRLPIDFFLRSLAQDQRERSIGVILSGMGSDGALGLRAIQENSGLVLVQEPATAKFDGMPRSAIDAGLVDIVATAEELPARIIDHLRRSPQVARSPLPRDTGGANGMEKLVILLRAHTGHDFSLYKRNTLHRRVERRMGLHQIRSMAAYARYLQANSQEMDLLFKELLIGVTNFFRDPAVWEQLRAVAIPALLANWVPGRVLRAWVPGCSTGEEAYSLAMVFRESVERLRLEGCPLLQIFATDLDRDAIDKARQGFFEKGIASEVSAERLARFFTREDRGYRVRKEIRETVIFASQNLLMDPPFTKLDILSCRNVLIYFTPGVQRRLMPLFHYSLVPGGLLVLGSAETVGDSTDLFAPLPGKSRIFRRVESGRRRDPVGFPVATGAVVSSAGETWPAPPASASLQSLADQLVLQRFAPSAVLVNDKGDICYVSGRTGKYLEPAAGKANWNIFVMAREGLRYELSAALQKALRQPEMVTLRGLSLGGDGDPQRVDVAVQGLDGPGALQGLVLIVFTDVLAPVIAGTPVRRTVSGSGHAKLAELERELLRVRAEARATHEDMQTSQEEFRSANEELQSMNEELTTSKEEMQSLNEELQTLNAELQAKVDELSCASNDMKNLLDSTHIATLFLDNELNVRRFTPQTTKIIQLIAADEGRPITDLASQLRYPELTDDAREVLRSLVPVEKPIAARNDRWFSVRIMPYRTVDDRIDGVVITFTDITASKELEARLRGMPASGSGETRDGVALRAGSRRRIQGSLNPEAPPGVLPPRTAPPGV